MLSLAVALDLTFDVSKSRDWPFGDFLLSGVESFQAGLDYEDGRDWRWVNCGMLLGLSLYFFLWYIDSVFGSCIFWCTDLIRCICKRFVGWFYIFSYFSDTLYYCDCVTCECYRLYSRALSGLLPRGDLIVESGHYRPLQWKSSLSM